jgi:hypothetical protein
MKEKELLEWEKWVNVEWELMWENWIFKKKLKV